MLGIHQNIQKPILSLEKQIDFSKTNYILMKTNEFPQKPIISSGKLMNFTKNKLKP